MKIDVAKSGLDKVATMNSPALHLLVLLSAFADANGRLIFLHRHRVELAAKMKLSPRTVQNCLTMLVTDGWVKKVCMGEYILPTRLGASE